MVLTLVSFNDFLYYWDLYTLIDWEYPGRQGAGCNEVDEDKDIDNFLVLLQELRKTMDKELNAKELTIAAHVNPLKTNMSNFAKVLDRINIMTYDLNGAWNEQTAPNSPLYAADGALSFSSSVESWINAGVSASKLTGGVAYYGRSTSKFLLPLIIDTDFFFHSGKTKHVKDKVY